MSPSRLFTVAFPKWSPRDADRIDAFRREHHADAHARVAPHVTLVFGSAAVPTAAYLQHVGEVAKSLTPVTARFRCAMLGADDEQPLAYVFLVPDEGHGALSLWHDRLYTGPLAPALRLDLPYTPHVTIGASADRLLAKAWCDELNRVGLDMSARLSTLTVGGIVGDRFESVAEFELS